MEEAEEIKIPVKLPFNLTEGIMFTWGTRKFTILEVWRSAEARMITFCEDAYPHKKITRSEEYLTGIEIRYSGIKKRSWEK